VDPEIAQKLEALEKEEEQVVNELEAAAMGQEDESDLDSEEEAVVEAIRNRKNKTKVISRMNRGQNKPVVPRHVRGRAKDKHQPGALDSNEIRKKMDKYGVDTSKMLERGRKRERSIDRRREKDRDNMVDDVSMAQVNDEGEGLSKSQQKKIKRERSESRKREESLARSHSKPRTPSQRGLKDEAAVKLANKKERDGGKSWHGMSGEGDRRQSVHLVQWCNTGKKRMGTTYQR